MKTLDGNCRLGIGAAVLMLLAGAAASVHAGDYYASPAGDDNAPGAEGQASTAAIREGVAYAARMEGKAWTGEFKSRAELPASWSGRSP